VVNFPDSTNNHAAVHTLYDASEFILSRLSIVVGLVVVDQQQLQRFIKIMLEQSGLVVDGLSGRYLGVGDCHIEFLVEQRVALRKGDPEGAIDGFGGELAD